MKGKILAVVIPALLATSAVHAAEVYNKDGNKLDLYGKVVGLRYFSDQGDDGDNGDKSYVRLGFKGETQISSQLTGFGRWENEFKVNAPEGSQATKTRLGYVGLKFANVGSIDYGRNIGVVDDVSSYTDELPEFGGDSNNSDNFMQSRSSGLLTYRNSSFFGLVDGLDFALQYQGKNSSGNVLKQNGDSFGMSIAYEIPSTGITIGGALSTGKRTDAQNDITDLKLMGQGQRKRAQNYVVGIKYDANSVYVAAMYKQSYSATPFGNPDPKKGTEIYGFASKSDFFEVVAQYTFDFGLTPSLAYLQAKGHDIRNATTNYGKQDLWKYVDVGATYSFNKNMSAYVDYKINLLKENEFTKASSAGTDNIVALGLVYQF